MSTIGQLISRIVEAVRAKTEAVFGPLSAPEGQEFEQALFEAGVQLPEGCGKRELQLGSRGQDEREELLVVLRLSDEALSAGGLAEAKRWAEETYAAIAAIDEVVRARTRVVVSSCGRRNVALFRVSSAGAEELES